MNADSKTLSEPIRMVFELSREDHPRLYDDLIRFPKGTKRINRLRVLAYDGLLVQNGQTMPSTKLSDGNALSNRATDGNNALTNDLFAPSITE